MGFSFNPIDINISLYYRVGKVLYEERYGDRLRQNATNIFQAENDKALYVVDDPKVAKDVYQGNVQTTRSFLPPTHRPLFDPRNGRGISIHHQLGSVGYYTTGNSNSGNIDGIQENASSMYRYDIQNITNTPKLYVGIRRVGEPKWFYILGRDVSIIANNYQENYKSKGNHIDSNIKFRTDVYASGGEGVPNFDPINISGITQMNGSRGTGDSWSTTIRDTTFDSRVLQMHVCYMPNDKYYLMLYNENLPNVLFPGSDIPKKYWVVLESYGVHSN
jgi:hypothetical protein